MSADNAFKPDEIKAMELHMLLVNSLEIAHFVSFLDIKIFPEPTDSQYVV